MFGQAILDYLGISRPALLYLVLWVSMRYSVVILRLLKDSGILLVTRIAGLLLAAIAVQLVADAVRAFVEGG